MPCRTSSGRGGFRLRGEAPPLPSWETAYPGGGVAARRGVRGAAGRGLGVISAHQSGSAHLAASGAAMLVAPQQEEVLA